MTRIAPLSTPAPDAECAPDRAPAGSRGAFRAALRAAGKEKAAAKPAGDDVYTISSHSPMAATIAPGSIDSSLDEPDSPPVVGPVDMRAGTSTRDPVRARVAIPIGDLVRDPAGAPTAARVDAPGEILLDTMLANAGIATAVVTAPQQPPAPAIVVEDSPVATWVARAIGSRGNAADARPPAPAAGGDVQIAPAAAPMPAATPLEQAVHDLIGRFLDRIGERDDDLAPSAADARDIDMPLPVFASHTAPAPAAHDGRNPATAPAHPARETELPEPPGNPSHVHLVLDDGPERTVVTVAVRGSEVHVALRSHDDATAAALARNAASLDHAMRARGLELGELTADREPSGQRPPRDPEPRERPARDAERFTLEETP